MTPAPPGSGSPAGDGAEEIEERLAAWWRAAAAVPDGAEVLVACSGGPDSLALLLCLARLPLRLRAVHVDHGLRAGTEAESALVASVAASVGAASELLRVEVDVRGNRMAAARRARYQALAECARRTGARAVAVGHTATDQAETVVFRRERGDAPAAHALAGMPVRRPLTSGVELLRPLLGAGVDRAEARALVLSRGLCPFDDPTNGEARFARVRIRQQLGAAPPQATRDLLRLAAEAATSLAGDEASAAALGDPRDLLAAAVAAASPEVVVRLLRRAGHHGARLAQARQVLALCARSDGSRGVDLGGGLRAERRYGRLHIGPPEAPPPWSEIVVEGPGLYQLGDRLVELRLCRDRPSVGAGAALDASALRWPLSLRNFRPGDRLRRRAGGRKLHDVLIDEKVPRWLRPRLALLSPVGSPDLLWAEGVGCAVGAEARAGSAPTLLVELRSPTEIRGSATTADG